MKKIIASLVAATAFAAFPSVGGAQTFPERAITLVVPFSAGGPTDTVTRLIAEPMKASLGQDIVVQNVTGAGGTVAAGQVANAEPDGYTVLITNCSHSSNAAYYRKLPYDPLADFAPITQMDVTSGNLLIVHASIPARSVKEFIALAKARHRTLWFR